MEMAEISDKLSVSKIGKMDDTYQGLGEYQYVADDAQNQHDSTNDALQRIDRGLKGYYRRLGVSSDYKQEDIQPFLPYMEDEEVNASDLPAEPVNFPLPHYVLLDRQYNNILMFYIVQYCYKLGKPPPDQYIQETIIPKCQSYINKKNPEATEVINDTALLHRRSRDGDRTGDTIEIYRQLVTEFRPRYPYFNVYFAKKLIANLRQYIQEKFDDVEVLHYYIDMSISLQLNDKQLREFIIDINGVCHQISIINFDLHCRSTGNCLYGIIVPQYSHLWQLHGFMTAADIEHKYDIIQHELPKSSRNTVSFQRELQHKLAPNAGLLMNVNWYNVAQVKRRKNKINYTIEYDQETWINDCQRSLDNDYLPLVPIVVTGNNKHWMEWVKIIHIEFYGINIGISFKYNDTTIISGFTRSRYEELPVELNSMIGSFYGIGWVVSAIYFDIMEIYKRHRLTGIANKEILQSKNVLKVSGIRFSGLMDELEQHIQLNQEDIARLWQQYESYFSANNTSWSNFDKL